MPYLQREETTQEGSHYLERTVCALALSAPFPALTSKLKSWNRDSLIQKMSVKNSGLNGIWSRWQQIIVPLAHGKSPQLLRLLRPLRAGELFSMVNNYRKPPLMERAPSIMGLSPAMTVHRSDSKPLHKLLDISSFRCWT